MHKRIWAVTGSLVVSFLATLGLVLLVSPRTEAAVQTTIVVDTLADELNNDGDCSLREALAAANTNAAVDDCPAGSAGITDTISFDVAGTVVLTAQLSATGGGPLVIDGGEMITVSGDSSVRAVWVDSDAHLVLLNLAVVDGYASADGGGIYNLGRLDLANTTLTGNDATYGGCLYNNGGVVTIRASTFRENEAFSGSIYNASGSVSITHSVLSGNVAANTGGGIYNEDVLTVTNSLFNGNSADQGGGLWNWDGVVRITGSTFSGNVAYGYGGNGGGLYSYVGAVTVQDSTFTGNVASGGFSGNGGGIYNGDSLTISRITLFENQANYGGGIYNSGTLILSNSTLSGNSAGYDGGGLQNTDGGTLTVTYSTIAANSAAEGGGLNNSGAAMLSSSIVASSQEVGNCAGSITDGGYNIDSGDTCGFDPANNSMPNTDPMLGELSDNGGSTPTHALLFGSPAMDAANPGSCPATDQRGVPRPADGDGDGEAICDIGSFEFRPAATISKSADPDVVSAGGSLTYTLQITNLAYCTSTTTITDFLPAHVTPTGTLLWTPVEIAPGGTWTETVVVTVEVGYHGVLTNVLQATSLEGYRGIFTLTTPVYPAVQADFVAHPTAGLSPLTVILTNTSTGEYDTSLWLFGDGVTSTLTSPTHTYVAVGSYTVTLTVDGSGGTDTEIKERYITVQHGVYLPVILRGG